MSEFFDAALAFPAVIFTFLLILVVAYWLAVIFGGIELEEDAPWLGLGGVPAGITISFLIALAWFLCLAGGRLVEALPLANLPVGPTALRFVVLGLALAGAWFVTRLLVVPLRRLFPEARQPSRADFIGRTCVIRTGQAGPDFGQAEVTAADGSSALIQVRTTGTDRLGRGDSALIFEYDAESEFFWVMPYQKDT
jgi:hypothetical protein